MADNRRRQLMVDTKVQGGLLLRIGFYWITCLIGVALMMGCWIVLTKQPASSSQFLMMVLSSCAPALLAALVLLPMVAIDCLRLSNRFAGPAYRVRSAMSRLARGEQVEPLKLRDGDYWRDFVDDFNSVAEQLQARPSDADASSRSGDELAPTRDKSQRSGEPCLVE